MRFGYKQQKNKNFTGEKMELLNKWINKSFKIDLPNDYLEFLKFDKMKENSGRRFDFYNGEKLNSTDIHYFYRYNSDGTDGLIWNYNNYLSEKIISKDFLPIAEDSCGNLICMSMNIQEYSYIYYVLHDSYEMTYYFVAKSFSEWILKTYQKKADKPLITDNKKTNEKYIEEKIYNDKENESVSLDFFNDNKMEISPSLKEFYLLNRSVDFVKTIEFSFKNTKYSFIFTSIFSLDRAISEYEHIIENNSHMEDYFPIGTTVNDNFIPLLKVKKRNKGKIYVFSAFSRDFVEVCDSIDTFFKLIDLEECI